MVVIVVQVVFSSKICRMILGNTGNTGDPNSEFELSTDTDDDSLNGEPDSSNMTSPWEIAVDALKDTSPEDREKVMHIIKVLIQENAQLRQYGIENARLLQELRSREEQLAELQQKLQEHRRQLSLLSPASSNGCKGANTLSETSADVTPPNSNSPSLPSETTTKSSPNGNTVIAKTKKSSQARVVHHQKPETEKIKVPQKKKSSRRSPEETVVILNHNLQLHQQQHHLRVP